MLERKSFTTCLSRVKTSFFHSIKKFIDRDPGIINNLFLIHEKERIEFPYNEKFKQIFLKVLMKKLKLNRKLYNFLHVFFNSSWIIF